GEALGGDFTEAANRQSGSRKGLAVEESLGDAESFAGRSDLVFEELAKRFDEGQMHLLGQPPDVVVALDDRARPLVRDALDDVGIKGSLHQETRAFDLLGLLLE